jgi:hypothetical protein
VEGITATGKRIREMRAEIAVRGTAIAYQPRAMTTRESRLAGRQAAIVQWAAGIARRDGPQRWQWGSPSSIPRVIRSHGARVSLDERAIFGPDRSCEIEGSIRS